MHSKDLLLCANLVSISRNKCYNWVSSINPFLFPLIFLHKEDASAEALNTIPFIP